VRRGAASQRPALALLAIGALLGIAAGTGETHALTGSGACPFTVSPDAVANGAVVGAEPVAAGAGTACKVTYRSDGLRVRGYVIVPTATTGPLPVLLFARGGTGNDARIARPLLSYLSDLAHRGPFIVLATDYRGTDGGDGRDEYGGADVNDVLNLIPLAARIPKADTGQVLLLGFSRGGINTYRALGMKAPIRAAAVVSAPVDLARTYEQAGFFRRRAIRNAIGASPDDAPDAYRRRSALAWPDAVTVPVLILHGGRDDRIDSQQIREFAQALAARGKPHGLMEFPEGDHMLHNERVARDDAILAWFDRFTSR